MTSPVPASRNAGIDMLRGLSIVLVVMHHIAIRIPLTHTALAFLPRRLLDALCWNGYESVFVFFVISGFLITGNALRRWPSLGLPAIAAFYRRRAARILPCLILLVAVLAVLDLARIPNYTITRPDQSLPRAILAALGLHLNWYEGATGYLPGGWDVLWSLSIEEVFYLGFPIACLLARRSQWPFVMPLLLLALSLPISRFVLQGHEIQQEKAYLPGMAAIATGVLAALLAHRWRPSPRAAAAMIVLGATAWLAILFVEDLIWPYLGQSTMLLLTIGIATLLLGLNATTLPGPAWLQAFGRLSYEVYLTHMFVVFSLLALFHQTGASNGWAALLYPITLTLALALGWLTAWAISTIWQRQARAQPWTRWGRKAPDPDT